LTPYVAVIFAALLTYLVALGPSFFGVSDFDAQGYFGTLCSFGFLTVYVLISVAAPMFVRKTGELKINVILVAVAATVFMIVPFLGAIGVPGSELFPLPTYPNNLLIWMYLAYMVVGAARLLYLRKTRPDAVEDVFEVTDVPLSPERPPRKG
jgi:amino acid transporter